MVTLRNRQYNQPMVLRKDHHLQQLDQANRHTRWLNGSMSTRRKLQPGRSRARSDQCKTLAHRASTGTSTSVHPDRHMLVTGQKARTARVKVARASTVHERVISKSLVQWVSPARRMPKRRTNKQHHDQSTHPSIEGVLIPDQDSRTQGSTYSCDEFTTTNRNRIAFHAVIKLNHDHSILFHCRRCFLGCIQAH